MDVDLSIICLQFSPLSMECKNLKGHHMEKDLICFLFFIDREFKKKKKREKHLAQVYCGASKLLSLCR